MHDKFDAVREYSEIGGVKTRNKNTFDATLSITGRGRRFVVLRVVGRLAELRVSKGLGLEEAAS